MSSQRPRSTRYFGTEYPIMRFLRANEQPCFKETHSIFPTRACSVLPFDSTKLDSRHIALNWSRVAQPDSTPASSNGSPLPTSAHSRRPCVAQSSTVRSPAPPRQPMRSSYL